ncbi:hypothetical protein D9757_004644 [Collybiopsis confluens]|uniref:Uncharacterized protein n=1 Tax=Collybiopsis confluens TaxID=2823264 RepID=A0A8H5MBK5_9AGAR|nr:hypothetical protein D9757_004644 [Collybiopsis confluens]
MTAASSSSSPVTVVDRRSLRFTSDDAYKAFDSSIVHLGPFDQLVPFFIPVTIVLVYKKIGPDDPIQVERLQAASELLLDYYPHLTGRLHVKNDGAYAVTDVGAGAELLIAQCSEPLDAFTSSSGRILLLDLPDGGNDLLAPFEPTLESVSRGPLFTIQHTRFACGSVGIGVRLPHWISDADGAFQLVRDLASLYRDLSKGPQAPKLSERPHIHSYMSDQLDMSLEEKQMALTFQPSLIQVVESVTSAVPQPDDAHPTVGRTLRLSGQAIMDLKAKATDPTDDRAWVSTFEAISAMLHQCVYQARLQYYDGNPISLSPPDFLNPVNFRDRLDLPRNYFPNALLVLYTPLPHDTLVHAPVWQVAKHLHDLNRNGVPEADHIRRTLRWINAQPDKRRLESGFRYGNASLMVSQWNKFGLYDRTEFQDGERPVLISTPFTPISLVDGLAYVLPTEMEGQEGGDKAALDVNLALKEPIWKLLEQNERFSSMFRFL